MISQQSKPFATLIIGSTGAIGSAFKEALLTEPYRSRVVELNRVTSPGFDLFDAESIENALLDSKFSGPFDLIVDATGALTIENKGPEKSLKMIDGKAMQNSFWVNCIGPSLLLKSLVPRMSKEQCVYAKLSARVGSISDNKLGGWYSYRASKAAFNMILQTAAIEHHRRITHHTENDRVLYAALSAPAPAANLEREPKAVAAGVIGTRSSAPVGEAGATNNERKDDGTDK